jgi:hypothetical protein
MTTRPPSPPDPNVSGAGRLGVNSQGGGVRRFWPLALMVVTGLLFTTHPAMIRYVGAGLVVFVVSAFALIFGAYAFVLSAPQRAKRAGFTLSDASFVGYDEGNTRLRVIEEGNAACRVEMTRGYYAIVFLALAAAGPGLLAALLLHPDGRTGQWGNPMIVVTSLFALGLCALLVRIVYDFLFRRPSMRMAPNVVELRRGRTVVSRFTRKDIQGVSVDERLYVSSHGHQERSAILVAQLSDGTTKRLVASGRQEDVDAIAKRMRFLLGLH